MFELDLTEYPKAGLHRNRREERTCVRHGGSTKQKSSAPVKQYDAISVYEPFMRREPWPDKAISVTIM